MTIRSLRSSLSVLVFLMALSFVVRAQTEPAPQPKNTDDPANGVITGKVVNESGQPIAGATVFVRPINSVTMGRSTTADNEGNFRVGGLEAALYNVVPFAATYANLASDPDTITTYHRIGDNVRVEMIRGGVLTGTVSNAAGEPVIAVRVRATMIRDAKGQPPKMMSASFNEQTSDDRGIYRIWGLAPGTYVVSAGGSSFAQPFQFNPYDSDSPTYSPSSTRDTAAEVSVRSGEDTTADIRYRSEPGYIVSGTVKARGEHDPAINLLPAGGTGMPTAMSMQFPGSKGFAFYGVGDGEYDLIAQEITSGLGQNDPTFALSDAKRITVRGGNVTGIELVTKALPSLSGRVVLESSKIQECESKRPPAFAETVVKLHRPDEEKAKEPTGSLSIFGGLEGADSPDRNGAFGIRNVLPGRYQFEPRFYARYWYLKSITLGAPAPTTAKTPLPPNDAAAKWTIIKSGDQITNLTITLAEGAASVKGKLTLAEGAAAPAGALFFLLPAEPDKVEDVLRFFVTPIEGDGSFTLSNLPPGKYWSIAEMTSDAQLSSPLKIRQPESAAARTKLRRRAESLKNSIDLKPCQNVTDYQIAVRP